MKRYLPNFLTMGRMVFVPPIVVLLFFPGRLPSAIAGVIFLVASITDYLDGFIARRFRSSRPSAAFLTP